MKAHEAKRVSEALSSAIVNALNKFVDDTPGSGVRQGLPHPRYMTTDERVAVGDIPPQKGNGQPASAEKLAPFLRDPEVLEFLFREFRNRMIDSLKTDPIFVKLLAVQTEIEVEITPRVLTLDGSTTKGRLGLLVVRGFFDSGKRQGEARSELARTGGEPNSGQLSTLFSEFVSNGFLEKTSGDRYIKAPGLKCSEKRIEA